MAIVQERVHVQDILAGLYQERPKGVATINSLLSLTWKTEEAHLEELAVRME